MSLQFPPQIFTTMNGIRFENLNVLESPWTISWAIKWEHSQATLHVKLLCDGNSRGSITMATLCSFVGCQVWQDELLMRFRVARTSINIEALNAGPDTAATKELMKKEDCQRFADEIISTVTGSTIPISGI